MRKLFLMIMLFISLINIYGQSVSEMRKDLSAGGKKSNKSVENPFTGNLNYDSKISFSESEKVINADQSVIDSQKKSVWLAAGLSALLPGAGEFYSESYFKSAAFLAVEAAAISLGVIYNKKGDDQTNFFQNYADQHWSVDRYAKWTLVHATSINSAVNPASYSVFVNGKVNWAELNRLENDLGSYYSHKLPKYGEQQYFELIGKYPQFNVGWDDFGNENTSFVYGDPLTQRFLYYSEERGKANDYYNVASKAVLVVVVNHIISAFDAAWTAHSYNKSIELNASLESREYGFYTVYYPQLNFQFRF